MAAAEAEASGTGRSTQSGTVYDGFISYSHAADDLLAPRLQAGLQKFAKPWWKRRALRVFRDKASLAANPHLWSSITQSLDDSAWFILLLSPDAAESPWVNREVEYWLAHKDRNRIIPVLTEGTFGWENGDITSDAAPPALSGVFRDEPRWVDLRFARSEEQLDLKNPLFAEGVADVASALRGVPKDELASEEVKQHRRTVRTVWAAGIALSAFAIAAVAFGVRADQEATRADQQAELAREKEAFAVAEAERAAAAEQAEADQRAIAESEAANALDQAAIAKSRELAAAAISVLDVNPELAMMLALESIKAIPRDTDASPTGVMSLRQAMLDNRLIRRFDVTPGRNFVAISTDGETIFHSSSEQRTVSAIDIDSGEVLWTYDDPTTIDPFTNVEVSPDGLLVSLLIPDFNDVVDSAVPLDENGLDGHPARIVLLSSVDGSVVRVLYPGPCEALGLWGASFTADGRWFAVGTGSETCSGHPEANWVAVYDTATWEVAHLLMSEGGRWDSASFSADSSRVLVYGEDGRAELRSFPDGQVIQSYGVWPIHTKAVLRPDGEEIVVWSDRAKLDMLTPGDGGGVDLRPGRFRAETGEFRGFLDGVNDFAGNEPLSVSPNGSFVAVTTRARDFVFDASTGRLSTQLGESGFTWSHGFDSTSSRLVTSTDTSLLVWELGGSLSEIGVPISAAGEDPVWFNPDAGMEGPQLAAWTLIASQQAEGGFSLLTTILDSVGRVTDQYPGWGDQLPDGRFVLTRATSDDGSGVLAGPIVIWDPTADEVIDLTDCVAPNETLDLVTEAVCPDGDPYFGYTYADVPPPVFAASDGSYVAGMSYFIVDRPVHEITRLVRTWDPDSGNILSEFEVPSTHVLLEAGPRWMAFSTADGSVIILNADSGEEVAELFVEGFGAGNAWLSPDESRLLTQFGPTIAMFDTASWQEVAQWVPHDAPLRGSSFSPDGARLVTTGEDNFVKVWDVSDLESLSEGEPPPLLDRIPAPKPSDAVWLSDDLLGVLLADDAKWLTVSLKVDDLVTEGRERLTRGFTPGECATYRIENCPMTLEEIRAG